jgi:hypothetical protein
MKKFLSIFVALAMAFSLFAGVGAGLAKADSTFAVTSSGNFFGGIDILGASATDGLGTVVAGTYSATTATVNVTTAAVGIFAGTDNVSVTTANDTTAAAAIFSTDANWGNAGNQIIAFTGTSANSLNHNDVVTVAGAVSGVGTIKSSISNDGTRWLYYVGVSTTIVSAEIATDGSGSKTGRISKVNRAAGSTTSSSEGWRTTGTKLITFSAAPALGASLDVGMNQLQAAVSAYAYLTLSGTVSSGNVAGATWQDTTGVSHSASYTASSNGEAVTDVATGLQDAINAVSGGLVSAVATGSVVKVTQIVAGTVGNGKTLTASASSNTVTIHTLGGLTQPAYVEVGKTIQLVATDQTGAIVTPTTWTAGTTTANPIYDATGTTITGYTYSTTGGTNVTLTSGGLVLGVSGGAALITATLSNGQTGQFVVMVIDPQTLTSLAVNLVTPALAVAYQAQFGAIATSAGYSALDYTTQATWSDTLPVAVVSDVAPTQGRLTYSTAETGTVNASVGSLAALTTVTIDASGVLTATAGTVVPVATKTVIVLTIGTNIVSVDGRATSVDAAPEIVNSRTFVPIRFIAETFGSTVTWLPVTKGITITLGTTTIGLQIKNGTAVINGKVIALDAAPYIKNSRTMVPLRVISESFGGSVVWDATNSTVTITYQLP